MTKKKICLSILVLALAAFLALGGFVGLRPNLANGEAEVTTPAAKDGIVVTAKLRDQDGTVSGGSVYVSDGDTGTTPLPAFDGVNISQFMWENVDRFEIKADKSQIESNIKEGTSWSYSISLQYSHQLPSQDGKFNGALQTLPNNEIASGDVTDLNQISATYYIDAQEDESRISQNLGWGIYRFEIRITNTTPTTNEVSSAIVDNEEVLYSNLFYVAPNEITEAPEVERRAIHSDTKLEGDYEFTITNYEYVNADNIRWYVIGKTKDDKTILFHQSDLSNGVNDTTRPDYFNFPGKVEFLRTSAQERETGSTKFVLDTGNREAEWQVFCVVYDGVPSANGDNIRLLTPLFDNEEVSRSDTFSTVKDINPFNVLWIIIACAVVLVIGLVVIIVVSVRKEKVW